MIMQKFINVLLKGKSDFLRRKQLHTVFIYMAWETLAVHRQTGGVGYFLLSAGHESHDMLVINK